MHVGCWQQNGYKCVEYGQNCKDGIQDHVDMKEMFSQASLRDTYQTLAGVLAGLVSWIFFEFTGRGIFDGLGKAIANTFYLNEDQKASMLTDCGAKVSALLTVGLLLGFFLSLVFRYNDEYRKKDAKVYMKIVGLSLLSGLVGFLAMLVGGIIFCLLLFYIESYHQIVYSDEERTNRWWHSSCYRFHRTLFWRSHQFEYGLAEHAARLYYLWRRPRSFVGNSTYAGRALFPRH